MLDREGNAGILSFCFGRGWLERVLHMPRDKPEFQELDRRLIAACLNDAHLTISDTSASNLQQTPVRAIACGTCAKQRITIRCTRMIRGG